MGTFITASRQYLDQLTQKRPGETKVGEYARHVEQGDWQKAIREHEGRFVVITIPEDIGVRAFEDTPGTHTICKKALEELLDVEHGNLLNGSELLILGSFDFSEEMKVAETADANLLNQLTGLVDEQVYPVIQAIVAAGKIPIIIGGGQSNAYPVLKGTSEAKGVPVNCINLDAHSDFRMMDGRNNRNGFRYAHRGGYLEKYAVIGLHENYNPQVVIEETEDDPDLLFTFFEDIFVREKYSFYEATRSVMKKMSNRPTGLEIDMRCIEGIERVDGLPTGITTIQARRFVNWVSHTLHPVYLHISEGIYQYADGSRNTLAPRLIAYLITDFIKAYREKRSTFL